MKRGWMFLLLTGVILIAAGCGSKKETATAPVESDPAIAEESVKEETAEEPKKDIKAALAGVYKNGDKLVTLPMGIYFDGSQHNYCNVQVPENYAFSSIYIDEKGTENSNTEISGMTVEAAMNKGADQQEYANQRIGLTSFGNDGTNIIITVMSSDLMSYDTLKEYVPNEVEFEEDAIYYVDENQYATADINMCRQINDDIFVSVAYEGPLGEELGLDQLAKNLYDLIEALN